MFYYNNDVLSTSILTLINTSDTKLASYINGAFKIINTKDINDQNVVDNINAMIALTEKIMNSERSLTKRELMIQVSELPFSDIVKMSLTDDYIPSSALKDELIKIFSILRSMKYIDPVIDRIINATNILRTGSLAQILPAYDILRNNVNELAVALQKLEVERGDSSFTIIDIEDETKSVGIQDLYDSIMRRNDNRVFTGHPAFDNATGGLAPSNLYITCALPGHFKTGLMMNLAEYIAINHKAPESPDGLKPCIYMNMCELTTEQIYIRRLAFHGRILTEEELKSITPEKLLNIFKETLQKSGSKIPIITSNRANKAPSTLDMANDVRQLMNLGYKPIVCLDDYADLHSTISKKGLDTSNAAASASELADKIRELKEFAKEFKIPVFTGAQINRDGEKFLAPAFSDPKSIDPAYYLNAGFLAKGHAINQIADMTFMSVYVAIDEPVNDGVEMERHHFYSFVIAKDREGLSKYKLSKRDVENQASYDSYTRRLKSTHMSDLIKIDGRYHAVMPVENYRLSLDFAKSIRMFYSNENAVFTNFSESYRAGDVNSILSELGAEANISDLIPTDSSMGGTSDSTDTIPIQDISNNLTTGLPVGMVA